MNFVDTLVWRTERFAIGVETESGRHYISFPVSNRMVDYLEYYEINRWQYQMFVQSPAAAIPFVEECRRREMDHLLFLPPGSDRGTPS
jgi:hypothetical protein